MEELLVVEGSYHLDDDTNEKQKETEAVGDSWSVLDASLQLSFPFISCAKEAQKESSDHKSDKDEPKNSACNDETEACRSPINRSWVFLDLRCVVVWNLG